MNLRKIATRFENEVDAVDKITEGFLGWNMEDAVMVLNKLSVLFSEELIEINKENWR